MSFFDDASLVFLPSGEAGKDGKAYSMKPTNGNGDFTFSRGSNLTATRVDSNGLIEKGRENLLLQSNQFDTTWTTFNASVTSGQSGYDGSSDAWLLNATGASGVVRQTISLSGVQTFSIYAKQGTADAIEINSFSNVSLKVNLTNGSVITSGSANINSSVTSISNGYYRITITANGSATIWRVYISKTSGSVTSGDNIYIQDAQLELGLVATEYIESGATTGKAGLLEDSPRFDYSGGASCPSLLLEPSRTNVWKYTEYLSYSFSQILSTTITQNTTETLSPEGLYNATKLEGIGFWVFKDFLAGTNTGTWTVSCWVKAVNPSSNNTFRLSVSGNNFSSNLTATNDWQRFYFSVTNGGATAAGLQRDTSANDADLYIYGLQVEEASYPTSYIPNHSGGSVTRNAEDIAINTLDQTYSTDITLFFEVERLVDNADTNKLVFLISDASGGGNNIIQFYSTDNGRIRVLIKDDTGSFDNLFSSNNSFIQGTSVKAAIKITQSGCTLFVDGSSVATTSSVGRVLGIDKINYVKDSIIKQFLLFPSALSDANCITLTS